MSQVCWHPVGDRFDSARVDGTFLYRASLRFGFLASLSENVLPPKLLENSALTAYGTDVLIGAEKTWDGSGQGTEVASKHTQKTLTCAMMYQYEVFDK